MLIFAALTNKKCHCGMDQRPHQDNVKQLQTLMAISPVLRRRLKPVVPDEKAYHNAPYIFEPCFEHKFVGVCWDEGPSPPYPGCWNPPCSNNGFHYTIILRKTAAVIFRANK